MFCNVTEDVCDEPEDPGGSTQLDHSTSSTDDVNCESSRFIIFWFSLNTELKKKSVKVN